MNTQILFKNIEKKTIVWFENSNQYLVVEVILAEILKKLSNGIALNIIAKELAEVLEIPKEKATDFILDIKKNILIPNQEKKEVILNRFKNITIPKEFEYTNYYRIHDIVFKVDFSSELELSLVHPKFAYLEIPKSQKYNFNYHVFNSHGTTFLYVGNTYIGSWCYDDIHYFQGKISMQIVQHIHHKPGEDWLGVFHASAVSDGKNGVLFLGDSGNGKSTSLALLQANGFDCIADDFVPVSALQQDIYSFPAAISIKKNSLNTLLSLYPELENSAEYHFKRLNKIVRFLPLKNKKSIRKVPCKGFVFIKYDQNIQCNVNKISNTIAFEKLIPDSWLSPLSENVKAFLDWYSEIPCYEIMYSDNDRMISEVSKLFKNVL
ncbi:MAG: hypothetical protein GKR88_19890 [Flavobacteriaceae bacterium]|nr:MAG: hypothetical protein GKR88_19890 [Flavobacteriaceae bacterium]